MKLTMNKYWARLIATFAYGGLFFITGLYWNNTTPPTIIYFIPPLLGVLSAWLWIYGNEGVEEKDE